MKFIIFILFWTFRVQAQENSDRFITLSADCLKNGSIELSLHTSEPFHGALYSRDFPSTCKSVGQGGTVTKLRVFDGRDCGVVALNQRAGKLVSDGQKENKLDMQEVHQISIYVQHDEHVQQVIDEQFLVQCWKGMAQGLVSYQDSFSNFVDKTLTKSIKASTNEQLEVAPKDASKSLQKRILHMVPMEPMTVVPPTTVAPEHENMVLIDEDKNSVDIGIARHQHEKKASGWMELVSQKDGQPLKDSVEVGSPVSLVIRLKHSASMDTMLSTCTAHSGDDFYDLTDSSGCTEDSDILPNFKALFNSRTGVKKLTSTFPMFKFPDETKVIIRCTVKVCNKNCPVSKCDTKENENNGENILDKFYLDTFAEVHDAGFYSKEMKEEEPEQLARTPALRSEQDLNFEIKSNYHKSQHQVMMESSSSVSKEKIIEEQREMEEFESEEEEDLLCLSPSRLALAFGILLVILLLALLGSCTMWMRTRSHLKRPKAVTMRQPRPPPPPPGAALIPARGPFMVASRGAPYIRVVQ